MQGMSMQEKDKNPFVVPVDHDIFALRDKEKQTKKKVCCHVTFFCCQKDHHYFDDFFCQVLYFF